MARNGITNQEIFTSIFRTNHWKSAESFSGPGSELRQTREIRKALPRVLKEYNIRYMLDIPCGDFNWMKRVDLSMLKKYIGADIIIELVRLNNKRYGDEQKKFIELDVVNDRLPRADLIFSRDCLVHLSNDDICKALDNIIRTGSKFFLATTYINEGENRDTEQGKWRPINLNKEPFNLPPFIKHISTNFRDKGRNYPGNGMALWRISDFKMR